MNWIRPIARHKLPGQNENLTRQIRIKTLQDLHSHRATITCQELNQTITEFQQQSLQKDSDSAEPQAETTSISNAYKGTTTMMSNLKESIKDRSPQQQLQPAVVIDWNALAGSTVQSDFNNSKSMSQQGLTNDTIQHLQTLSYLTQYRIKWKEIASINLTSILVTLSRLSTGKGYGVGKVSDSSTGLNSIPGCLTNRFQILAPSLLRAFQEVESRIMENSNTNQNLQEVFTPSDITRILTATAVVSENANYQYQDDTNDSQISQIQSLVRSLNLEVLEQTTKTLIENRRQQEQLSNSDSANSQNSDFEFSPDEQQHLLSFCLAPMRFLNQKKSSYNNNKKQNKSQSDSETEKKYQNHLKAATAQFAQEAVVRSSIWRNNNLNLSLNKSNCDIKPQIIMRLLIGCAHLNIGFEKQKVNDVNNRQNQTENRNFLIQLVHQLADMISAERPQQLIEIKSQSQTKNDSDDDNDINDYKVPVTLKSLTNNPSHQNLRLNPILCCKTICTIGRLGSLDELSGWRDVGGWRETRETQSQTECQQQTQQNHNLNPDSQQLHSSKLLQIQQMIAWLMADAFLGREQLKPKQISNLVWGLQTLNVDLGMLQVPAVIKESGISDESESQSINVNVGIRRLLGLICQEKLLQTDDTVASSNDSNWDYTNNSSSDILPRFLASISQLLPLQECIKYINGSKLRVRLFKLKLASCMGSEMKNQTIGTGLSRANYYRSSLQSAANSYSTVIAEKVLLLRGLTNYLVLSQEMSIGEQSNQNFFQPDSEQTTMLTTFNFLTSLSSRLVIEASKEIQNHYDSSTISNSTTNHSLHLVHPALSLWVAIVALTNSQLKFNTLSFPLLKAGSVLYHATISREQQRGRDNFNNVNNINGNNHNGPGMNTGGFHYKTAETIAGLIRKNNSNIRLEREADLLGIFSVDLLMAGG